MRNYGWTWIGAVSALLAGCEPPPEDACSTAEGTICGYAGTGAPGFDEDGHTLEASRFYWPADVTFTADGTLHVLDWNNHRVRALQADGTLKTIIGNDEIQDGPSAESGYSETSAPGAPGTVVSLNHPTQLLEVDARRMVLVSWHNHKLRVYDRESGLVTVLCGQGGGFADGPLGDARFNQPAGARLDADGNLYVLDQRNQRIRKITDPFEPAASVSTVVGTGVDGFNGDGLAPLETQLSFPKGSNPPPGGSLDFDAGGRLYLADVINDRVRRVDFAKNTVETVLGDGVAATLDNPRDVQRGPDGRIYVADEMNHRILALDPTTLAVEVVAGTGVAGNAGDGGLATEAQLNRPAGVAWDAKGNLVVSDTYNHRLRRIQGAQH